MNRAPHRIDNPALPPVIARLSTPAIEAAVRCLCEGDNRALEWHGGHDKRDFYETQWRRHGAGEITVLVVEWNRFPIAQGAVDWSGKPTHPHLPDIQSLRVFPAFQGLGVGSKLLSACEALVAGAGYREVSIAVGVANPRARALYERLGYRVIGQPYDDVWSYHNPQGEEQIVSEIVLDLVKGL